MPAFRLLRPVLASLLCLTVIGTAVAAYRLHAEWREHLGVAAVMALEPVQSGDLRTAITEPRRDSRDQQALMRELERAENRRLEAETTLAASRARIRALEAELGVGELVDALIDEAGQPHVAGDAVTPRHLAALGMELRVVERERDGARIQLDRALEQLAARRATPQAINGAGPRSPENEAMLAARVEALELANRDLAREKGALEAALAAVEVERATLVRASRDALASQAEAHAAALAAIDVERKRLRKALAEAVAQRPHAATNQRLEDEGMAAALSAAQSQIAALEAELDAIARFVGELRPTGSNSTGLAELPAGEVAPALATVPATAALRRMSDQAAGTPVQQQDPETTQHGELPISPLPGPR